MGMWIGMIISLTLNNVVLYLISSNPTNLTLYIVLPVLAVLFGILTLCIKKTIIIFATCNYLQLYSLNRSLYMSKSLELVFRSFSKLIFIF